MTDINGRIGTKFVDCLFSDSKVVFKEKDSIHNQMTDIWFVYFQRISKSLKTCDALLFDGEKLIEFTTAQKNIEKITDNVTCPVYFGTIDPLPWKSLMRTAAKHKWQREDWQHAFEDSGSASESDAEWKPPTELDSESDDDEPTAKRPCRREDE